MNLDSKIIYLLSILPFIFGLVLIGDGIHKIIKGKGGWISLVFGSIFLGIVVFLQMVF